MKSIEFSPKRRRFLRNTLIYGGGLSTIVGGVITLSKETHKDQFIAVEGPIRLGNLNLTVLAVEHNEVAWKNHAKEIKEAISQFPIIIPEYFPLEYNFLSESENPYVKWNIDTYRSLNYVFEEVSAACLSSGKDVWVVDPAYCENFGYVRESTRFPQVVIGGAASAAVFNWADKKKDDPDSSPRRKAMKNIAKFVGLSLFGFTINPLGNDVSSFNGIMGKPSPGLLLEQDIRRVMVAHALEQMGADMQSPNNALLIYPKEHWDKINYYLTHKNEREKRYKMYSQLRSIPTFAPLFELRHYRPNGANWTQIERTKLR